MLVSEVVWIKRLIRYTELAIRNEFFGQRLLKTTFTSLKGDLK